MAQLDDARIEGRVLRGLPVKGTQTGGRSLSPEDADVSTPYGFTYVATGRLGDVGKVHFVSTSRRGIGMLDVELEVATDFELDLKIDSRISISLYTNFGTATDVHVQGSVRLKLDRATNLWSGTGDLTSTSTSQGEGCPSIVFSGGGRYDWVVRDVRAEPGLPTSQLEAWMDAGPPPESFDAFVATLCPRGSLTGTVDLWENLFFILERDRFGAKGFLVDAFDALGVDASVWRDGLELGSAATWTRNCSDIETLAKMHTDCTETTNFTLRVVDPLGP